MNNDRAAIAAELRAHATEITDVDERSRIFLAPQTRWYREHSPSVDALIRFGPLVAVRFTDDVLANEG